MRILFLTLIALFSIGLIYAGSPVDAILNPSQSNANRYEVVAYQENFETGAPGWVHYDGASSPNNWHIYNNNDAQGNVWWMGDPALAQGTNIGGYHDTQYLVLDTPARTLSSANATLTFKLRYNVEATAGATSPYTGWDACNIRVSTNGGVNWIPISGTPAYNMTSSYAFGYEHGEGPYIPGWGGVQNTWTNASFNLSAYVGQSIKIRFAFASDPAYCTGDAAAMFGMMVDDISFGGYTNNGVNDGLMTWASLVPLGGDLWSIATDATAPSPTHVMRNQNASGTYNPSMLNYLVSPAIVLPAEGDIRADFMIKGSFTDPNTFPDVDYFGWEISANNGVTWYAMSNPYNDPNGTNYVYSDVPDTWASMVASFSVSGIISDYAGQSVKFRWYFRSDADTPSGTGIMIDDFKIYNDILIAAPENLSAVVNGSSVILNWDVPGSGGGGGEPGWLTYSGDAMGSSVGTNGVADFDVAAKWDPLGATNSIYPYVGMNITKIRFIPAEVASAYAVRVWTGLAGTLVVDQAVTNPIIGQWNEIILNTPFTIPSGTQIMAGYRCNATAGYPAGCDAGPQVEGYGNMIRWNNVWQTLSSLSATLTYNWNIKVYVADARGREYVLGELPSNLQATISDPLQMISTSNRDVTQYKIYRDGSLIAQVSGAVLTYTDTNVPGGVHSYYTTALYGANESLPSNTVSVFVYPPNYVELGYDDGTSEIGYNVGSTKRMGVKFSYPAPIVLKNTKVYVQTVGIAGIILQVFDDDGVDGMPGTQLAQLQYPAASVVQGWNTMTWSSDLPITNGAFYISILETTNASAIGMDTSSSGHSYKKITTVWEPVTQGEIMIRAIVEAEQLTDPFGLPTVLPTSMTVMAAVSIGGVPASNGDVLAAYVNVGGTPQLRGKQTIQVIGGVAGCMLQVYTESNGEVISFKVWDASADEVISASNTLASIVNGTVGSLENPYLINAATSLTQTFALSGGWNLISLNVSPADHSVASLIASIAANVQQIKGTEGVYIPNNPFSTLSSLTDGKAYNILMASASNWSVSGSPIAASTPLALMDGWNMVAYLPQSALPVATAIQSISTWLIQVKGTDGVYIPNNPFSTLTTMSPNKGYWIKLSGAHNLVYPSGSKEAVSECRVEIPVTILSSSMAVLAKCDAADVGDILFARVNGELRGAEKFISSDCNTAVLIQIYTENTGEEIVFSVLKPDNTELALSTTLSSQPQETIGTYPNFLILEKKAGEELVTIPTRLNGCYPNPFNPSTTISFSVAQDNSPVSIEIYNIKGQKISSLLNSQLPKGNHSIVWDGKDEMNRTVSSGVYFIRMNCEGYAKNIKIMLAK
jgi:hypothetical protein